jgi:hypothetical protein
VGKRGGKAKGFVAGARRLRRRAEWLAAALVLLSVPTLWLLIHQAAPASVSPVATPATQAISPPQATEAARTANTGKCDDPMVLVDRAHALPADYAPDDLVSLRDSGSPSRPRTRCSGARRRRTSKASWPPPLRPARS